MHINALLKARRHSGFEWRSHISAMQEDLVHLGLVDDDDIVLDEAALGLALLDNPDVVADEYEVLLGDIAQRLFVVANGADSAHEHADALARVLAGEFGFTGDVDTYDDPANADLIQVLERRRGLPVALSILYVAAARRLGWMANVLDVPGHVLVLLGQDAAPVIVDPFRGGARVGRDQLAAMLTTTDLGASAAVRHVAAMPNRAVLVRLLANQATRAEQAGKGRRALDLYGRMTLIAPDYGPAWWERARLEHVDGNVPAARNSLTAMLEITRDPQTRSVVTRALDALGSRR
jgi:regulator of sirC expression with transglutaminase-like and TPR domain